MTAPTPVVGDWVETWRDSALYEVLEISRSGEFARIRDHLAGIESSVRMADLTLIAHEDAE